DRVEFLGFVKDMPKLYAEVDLVVQSSYTEGLPNVILEAAYLRVPIVATAVGGTAEVVRHGYSAWVIEPRLEALIGGIDASLSNPSMLVHDAERAHAVIFARFSFDARTERLTQRYESLLARTRPRDHANETSHRKRRRSAPESCLGGCSASSPSCRPAR